MNNPPPGHDITAKERTVDVLTNENVDFKDLFLSPVVLSGLQKARFERPSPIQLKAIPYGRCGLDLIVQAKSGTGKTCVFTVISLEAIAVDSPCLQVIILAPTREIAIQIEDVIKAIGQDIKGLKVGAFIGGRPVSEDKVSAKNCHIAVGSPGRIFQLIELEVLKCQNVSIFVLDEADKLLDNNFQSQINSIYSMLPENKQMIAASATYPDELADFVKRYMRDPTFVRLNPKDMALLGIKQYYYLIGEPPDRFYSVFERKIKAVVELLKLYSFQQALIFSNYHSHAKDLSDACNSVGLPATYISGNLEQERRLEAMKMLKDFKCRVLISTDLTSRGIDASNVDVVVNLDVPADWETYMHRTGRAGRFGSHGAVISIVTSGSEKDDLLKIAKTCGVIINPLTCKEGKIIFGQEPIIVTETSSSSIKPIQIPNGIDRVGQLGKNTISSSNKSSKFNRIHSNSEADNFENDNEIFIHDPVQVRTQSLPKSSLSLNGNCTKNHPTKCDELSQKTEEIYKDSNLGNVIDENEILRIPSLPELMSNSSKPDSSQFSFAFCDLMENLRHYQEHGEFQELKRIETKKTKKDEKVKALPHDFENGLRLCYQNTGNDNFAENQREEVENSIRIPKTTVTKFGKHSNEQTTSQQQPNCKQSERGWWMTPQDAETSCSDSEAQISKNKEKNSQTIENKTRSSNPSQKLKSSKMNSVGKVKNKERKHEKSSKKNKKHKAPVKEDIDNHDQLPRSSYSEILLPRYSSNFPGVPSELSTYNPYLMYARNQYENAWYNYYYWWRHWHDLHCQEK